MSLGKMNVSQVNFTTRFDSGNLKTGLKSAEKGIDSLANRGQKIANLGAQLRGLGEGVSRLGRRMTVAAGALSVPIALATKELAAFQRSVSSIKVNIGSQIKVDPKLQKEFAKIGGELRKLSSTSVGDPLKQTARGAQLANKEYKRLEGTFRSLARQFPKGPTDIAGAATQLARAGISKSLIEGKQADPKKALDREAGTGGILRPLVQLSVADTTGASLDEITEKSIKLLKAFDLLNEKKFLADAAAKGISAEKALGQMSERVESYFATILKASTQANVSVTSLAESMKFAGGVLASAVKADETGDAFREVIAVTSVLQERLGDASIAGTALRGMMLQLKDPPKEVADKLKELGFSLEEIRAKSKTGRTGIIDILKALEAMKAQVLGGTATQAEFEDFISGIFQNRQVTAALSLIDETAESLVERVENMKLDGSPRQFFDDFEKLLTDNLEGSIGRAKSAIQNLGLSLGSAFGNQAMGAFEAIASLADAIAKFIDNNQELVRNIIIGIAVFGAVGVAVTAAGAAIATLSLGVIGLGLAMKGIEKTGLNIPMILGRQAAAADKLTASNAAAAASQKTLNSSMAMPGFAPAGRASANAAALSSSAFATPLGGLGRPGSMAPAKSAIKGSLTSGILNNKFTPKNFLPTILPAGAANPKPGQMFPSPIGPSKPPAAATRLPKSSQPKISMRPSKLAANLKGPLAGMMMPGSAAMNFAQSGLSVGKVANSMNKASAMKMAAAMPKAPALSGAFSAANVSKIAGSKGLMDFMKLTGGPATTPALAGAFNPALASQARNITNARASGFVKQAPVFGPGGTASTVRPRDAKIFQKAVSEFGKNNKSWGKVGKLAEKYGIAGARGMQSPQLKKSISSLLSASEATRKSIGGFRTDAVTGKPVNSIFRAGKGSLFTGSLGPLPFAQQKMPRAPLGFGGTVPPTGTGAVSVAQARAVQQRALVRRGGGLGSPIGMAGSVQAGQQARAAKAAAAAQVAAMSGGLGRPMAFSGIPRTTAPVTSYSNFFGGDPNRPGITQKTPLRDIAKQRLGRAASTVSAFNQNALGKMGQSMAKSFADARVATSVVKTDPITRAKSLAFSPKKAGGVISKKAMSGLEKVGTSLKGAGRAVAGSSVGQGVAAIGRGAGGAGLSGRGLAGAAKAVATPATFALAPLASMAGSIAKTTIAIVAFTAKLSALIALFAVVATTGGMLGRVFDTIKEKFQVTGSAFSKAFSTIGKVMGSLKFDNIFGDTETAGQRINTLLETVKTSFKAVFLSIASEIVPAAISIIGTIIQSLLSGIIGAIEGAFGYIKDLLSGTVTDSGATFIEKLAADLERARDNALQDLDQKAKAADARTAAGEKRVAELQERFMGISPSDLQSLAAEGAMPDQIAAAFAEEERKRKAGEYGDSDSAEAIKTASENFLAAVDKMSKADLVEAAKEMDAQLVTAADVLEQKMQTIDQMLERGVIDSGKASKFRDLARREFKKNDPMEQAAESLRKAGESLKLKLNPQMALDKQVKEYGDMLSAGVISLEEFNHVVREAQFEFGAKQEELDRQKGLGGESRSQIGSGTFFSKFNALLGGGTESEADQRKKALKANIDFLEVGKGALSQAGKDFKGVVEKMGDYVKPGVNSLISAGKELVTAAKSLMDVPKPEPVDTGAIGDADGTVEGDGAPSVVSGSMDVGPGAVADKAAADVPKQAAVVNLSSKEVQLSSTSGLQRFFMGLFAPSSGTKRSVNPYATGIGSSGPAYMPRRRTGGPVNAGGSYVVGEGGPEIFIPSTRGHILSNGLSNRIDGMFEDGTNDEMLEGLFEGFVNPETGGAFTSTEKKMNDLADQFKNLNGIRPDHPDDPFSLANPENLRINLERLSGLSGQGLIDEIAAREEERRQKVNELTQQIASPIGLGDSGGLADQDSPAQSNPDPFGLGMADLQFGDTALEEFQIDTRTLDFGAPGAGLQWSPLDWQEQSGITNAGDQRIEMVNEDQLAEGFKRDVLEAPVDLSGATMAPIRGLGETENVRRQSNPEASEVDPGLEETENARTQAELEASAERRRLNREAASKRAANRRAQRASEMPGYSPFTRSMLTIDPAAEAPAINAAALPNNANLGARAGAAANAITRNDLDVLAKDATIKEGHGLLKELIGKVSNSGLMGE